MIEDDKPYEGLKLDMLDLVGMKDQRLFGVLTDFQTGQLVREHVHGLKADAEKFKFALDHNIKRSKGCRVCFYTGFQMGFSGFGTQLDPSRECSYCAKEKNGPMKHPEGAARFWYYMISEYPDEGAVFPFRTEAEARDHAKNWSNWDEIGLVFGKREATEEEQIMIEHGRHLSDPEGMRNQIREWARALDLAVDEGDVSNVRDEMFAFAGRDE